MRRTSFYLPFLYVAVSLLQLLYVALIAVSPDQIIRPLLVLWVLLLLLLYPVNRLLNDWNWTGIFLTVFVLAFFFSSVFFSTMILAIVIFLLMWLVIGLLIKIKYRLRHVSNIMMVIGLFFGCYSFWVIGGVLSKVPWESYFKAINAVREYSVENISLPDSTPDIYYIVLDDYANSDILLELFGYDNSNFVDDLEKLGFFVPQAYHSNYPMTHLSLSTTLNMEYLQDFMPGLEQSNSRWLMKPFIDHSRVRTLLEKSGYQTISISSNWTITENTTADAYYHPYPVMLSDFDGFILGSTPSRIFGPLLQSWVSVRSAESQRKIILYGFQTLAMVPEIPGPKFVSVHFISPHPPFVFDEDGNSVEIPYTFNFKDGNDYPGTPESYRKGYIDQLQYVNRQLLETLSIILSNSRTPPIIVIEADHGSGLMTDFTSSSNTCVKERFSPFAAFYLPGFKDKSLLNDISAVNTFRIIFNQYFDTRLPPLENRQYFFKDEISSYDFVDVTERVNDQCN